MNTHALRMGGLMRCCLATLGEHIGGDPPEPKPGDVVPCKYCSESMIYSDGAWEWNHVR